MNNYTEKKFEGRGREGINEGKMAHILDAMQLLKKSWDELDARTIASCWKKAQLLDSARL